jgi:hypothetical protein
MKTLIIICIISSLIYIMYATDKNINENINENINTNGYCSKGKTEECTNWMFWCNGDCACNPVNPVVCSCCEKCMICVSYYMDDCCKCLFPKWKGCNETTI